MPVALSFAGNTSLFKLARTRSSVPKPPVPQLLQSNDPASDAEAALIRAAISAAEYQMSWLDEQLTVTANDKVRRDREACSQFARMQRAILSSIRRFPPELLGEIFLQCVPETEDPRENVPPWAVSHVCQWWRNVALSTPRLWSQIPMIRLERNSKRQKYPLLGEYLKRSCDVPVSFYLFNPFQDYESHPAIDALAQHSERWQTVTIESTFVTIHSLSRIRGHLSSLRTLQLKVGRIFSQVPFELFEIAPQLQKVTINGLYPPLLKLPWSQLTHYTERTLNATGGAPQVLRLAEQLGVLRMDVTEECISQISSDFTPAILDHLHTLRLNFQHGGTSFTPILDSLTVPSIQEIRISSPTGHLVQDLISLVSRSGCNLRRLALNTRVLEPGELTQLLLMTPNLSELEVTDIPAVDVVNLTLKPGMRIIVPKLRSLIVRTSRQFLLDGPQFDAMARSRCDLYTHDADFNNEQMTALHQYGIRRLQSVRIVSSVECGCLDKQETLEGWTSEGTAIKEALQLTIFHRALLHELPELDHESHHDDAEMPLSKKGPDLRRLDQIFNDMERYELVDIKCLYRSRLHFTLYAIGRISSQSIRGDRKRRISKRACALIKKWVPLIIDDLPNRRWMMLGRYSLVYVQVDDELRSSPDAVRIALGTKEGYLQEIDLFWPSHCI